MADKNLLEKLAKLGYPLFETEKTGDANITLAETIQTKDVRLWEGFPIVLANSAERGVFDYKIVNQRLKKSDDKGNLKFLLLMSLALYRALGLKFLWADKMYKSLNKNDKKQLNFFLNKFKEDKNFNFLGHSMSCQRIKVIFNNYFNKEHSRLDELLAVKEGLGLEYALSQIFSPKQKELFLKKLGHEKLTKTEKEYFSRVVKKKVLALANSELHRLSQKLLD